MSYTEIYSFGKDGNAELTEEVHNAWRGAMAIWRIMEERYLEPLPKPSWMGDDDYKERGYSRCGQPFLDEEHPLKAIWDLWKDSKISETDKIVLGSTFDNVVVMRENIEEIIKAFENFEGETSLKEQAEILRDILKDEETIAIAWNQTSVNGDAWSNYEEEKEQTPYNLLEQTDHWDLFKG